MTALQRSVIALLLASRAFPAVEPPPVADLKPAVQLVEKGELASAEQMLKAILARGENPRADDLLGVVYAREGNLKAAEGEFKKALAALPSLQDPHEHLARLYLSSGRSPEAKVELRRATLSGPLDRDLALALGEIELAEGRVDEAAAQFRSAADRFGSVHALMELARIESRAGKTTEALKALTKALQLAPNSEAVLAAYAQVALAAQAPVPATGTLEALARMEPMVAQHRYLLGVALFQAGDMTGAVDSLRQADAQEPNAPLTLLALGLALNNSKHYDEARVALLKSLALGPDNLETQAALSEAEEGLGDLDQAESRAKGVLAKAENQPTANLVIGMVLMKREQFAEARGPLEKAIAASPASWKAHYQLSIACGRVGDQVGAQKHLELYQRILKEERDKMDAVRLSGGMSAQ